MIHNLTKRTGGTNRISAQTTCTSTYDKRRVSHPLTPTYNNFQVEAENNSGQAGARLGQKQPVGNCGVPQYT